jgi:hypothetical protein
MQPYLPNDDPNPVERAETLAQRKGLGTFGRVRVIVGQIGLHRTIPRGAIR